MSRSPTARRAGRLAALAIVTAVLGLGARVDALPNIDTSKAFWTETELVGGSVNAVFQGGTLRMDRQATLGHAFLVDDAGGTIDERGFVTQLSGGAITSTGAGIGSLRFTDTLHTTNATSTGTVVLQEPIHATGTATQIDSGASLRTDGNAAVHGSFPDSTNLVLNGGLKLGYLQALASVAGTDPTATLDLGSSNSLTVDGPMPTTYAGAIAGTGYSYLQLNAPAHLTLSGTSTLTGYVFIDTGATLALAGTGSVNTASLVSINGTLDLSGTTAGATLKTFSGAGTIALGARTLTLSMPSNVASTAFQGTITGTGGVTVNVGQLSFANDQSYTGTTMVNAGAVLNLNASIGAGNSIVDNGTIRFGANPNAGILVRTLNAVAVNNGGTLAVLAAEDHANRTAVVVSQLQLAGAMNGWLGSLDLANNDLIVRNGSAATIMNQIRQAFHGGDWAGVNGIGSSSAAASGGAASLAYRSLNGNVDGVAVGTGDVVIQYTLTADANVDGKVDFSDLLALAKSYNGTGKTWTGGDFDYDGAVGFSDLLLLAKNFNHTSSAAGDGPALEAGGATFAADWSLAQSLVPEPTTGILVAAAALVAARRARAPLTA